MKITAVLPISRTKYLDRVLESLINQTVKPNNLLVVYDGPPEDFVEVRNRIVELKFEQVLCVKSRNNRLAFNIPDRRLHIVEIHKHFQELIPESDWIFSIEDDGILPENALENLIKIVNKYEDVGMATGVEVGRWGVPYVGAWRVDNIHDTRYMESIVDAMGPDVEEIDACGLYCALIRAGKYLEHEFTTRNGLGPDVNLGLYLRRQGYHNYVDWRLPVIHLNKYNGEEVELHPYDRTVVAKLKLLHGNIWQSYR